MTEQAENINAAFAIIEPNEQERSLFDMDGSSNKNLMTAPAMAAGRSQSEEGSTLDRGSSNQL